MIDIFDECTPVLLEPDTEHHSGYWNCNFCDDKDCENWRKYNE